MLSLLASVPGLGPIIILLSCTALIALLQIALNAGNNRTRLLIHTLRLEEKRIELELLRYKKENKE